MTTTYERTFTPSSSEYSTNHEAPASPEHMLGNPELPIADYREQIVNAVDESQAVVITAETGAGKSTQVPQMLAEAGYEVIVTQPRVVAARSVAERVQEEVTQAGGKDFNTFVGYRTANERGDNPDNQILFVTDGLQLMRELYNSKPAAPDTKRALVLDEVHEWNENMEVLVAWAKQRVQEDPNFKVVTMSATMEAEKLADYFNTDRTETSAHQARQTPVIEVPGRTFPVEKRQGDDLVGETLQLAKQGKNTLVFVPGKNEITEVMDSLAQHELPNVRIMPLHGQMEKQDQRQVFQHYDNETKVVVATNVAQTSITIDDIHAVVDSGLERQVQVRDGVEGLYLTATSQADCMQRAGRAGRVGPGEYVLAPLGGRRIKSLEQRDGYATPEIQRTHLGGMVLRLAGAGIDATKMDFYHQPDHAQLRAAKEQLQGLGALDEEGKVTKIGRAMERMPLEPHGARMLVEARKYGPRVRRQLAAALAVQEVGGIRMRNKDGYPEGWRSLVDSRAISEMVVDANLLATCHDMSDADMKHSDIFVKNVHQANKVYRRLLNSEKIKNDEGIKPLDDDESNQLLRCVVAGLSDSIYVRDGREYVNSAGEKRMLARERAIMAGDIVMGRPFNISANGRDEIRLITGITNVPLKLLAEVAPHSFKTEVSDRSIDAQGRPCYKMVGVLNNRYRVDYGTELMPPEEARQYLMDGVYGVIRDSEDYKTAMALSERMPSSDKDEFRTQLKAKLDGLLAEHITLETKTMQEAANVLALVEPDMFMSAELQQKLRDEMPTTLHGQTIHYNGGQALFDHIPLHDEQERFIDSLVEAGPDAYTLPDGREVLVPISRYALQSLESDSDLSEYARTVGEMSQRIEQMRQERAERAAQEEAARIEAKRREAEQARAAEEAERAAREKAAIEAEAKAMGLPSDITAYRRIGSNTDLQMTWVVRPDGSLREPDEINTGRSRRPETADGTMTWNQLLPGELLLQYSRTDQLVLPKGEVAYRPEEITEAQINAVHQLEEQMDMSQNAYGLDQNAANMLAERLQEIRKDMRRLPSSVQAPGASYDQLAFRDGVELRVDASRLDFDEYGPIFQIANRDAYLIADTSAAGGMLQALAYEKYGRWNANLRWLPQDKVADEYETARARAGFDEEEPEEEHVIEEDMDVALAGLKGLFNR